MDGDCICLLCNGVGVFDVLLLFYDYVVLEDFNSVECLEVVCGLVVLFYGGNVIGGVVNSFDNCIFSEFVDGIYGSGELCYGGVDIICSCFGVLEVGDGNFVLYVDVVSCEFNDVRIFGYVYFSCQWQIDGDIGKYWVQNSDGCQDGGVVGGFYYWEYGYVGFFYSGYDSNYGLLVEDDVCLKMQQDCYVFVFEICDFEGLFILLKLDVVYIKYEYKEIEDGEIGIIFKNEGYEGCIEVCYCLFGLLNGVVGVQFVNSCFFVFGEEVFVLYMEIDSVVLFVLEEWKFSDCFDFSFGVCLEYICVDFDVKGNECFVENDGLQSFIIGSLFIGVVYKLMLIWLLVVIFSYIECVLIFYELYVNGLYVVIGIYEVGDVDVDKEKVVFIDFVLCFDNGVYKGSVGVFYSCFFNYIGLFVSGCYCNEEGEVVVVGDDEVLLEYFYSGVCVDFYGVEVQDCIYLLESLYGNFDLEFFGDYICVKNKDIGELLLCIVLLCLNIVLIWELQQWQVWVDVEYVVLQYCVLEEEFFIDGYIIFGVSFGYNFDFGESCWLVFVKGINLINQIVCYVSLILCDWVLVVGCGIEVGVKVVF